MNRSNASVPLALSTAVLLTAGCTLLGPEDWDRWRRDHDSGMQGDSDPPDSDPPDSDPPDSDPPDSDPPDTGDSSSPPPMALDGISPVFGPRGGNSPVGLQGAGFDGDVEVRFDGAVSALTHVAHDELQILTPAMTTVGWVDVTVRRGAEQVAAPGAFRTLDLDDATGLAGLEGAVQWFDYQGGYWASGTVDYGIAQLWVPGTPADRYYRDLFAPVLDGCSSGTFAVDSAGSLDLGGAIATLRSTSGAVVHPAWDAHSGRFDTVLSASEFAFAEDWALEVVGLWDLPPFVVSGAVATPAAPTLSNPVFDGLTPPSLARDGLALRWTPTGADRVVVYALRLNLAGTAVAEVLTCQVADDGAFDVPAGAWTGWQSGAALHIFVGALRESAATVPLNNGGSRAVGIAWLIGGALAR